MSHHWGCTSIYQPAMSYPFRSLATMIICERERTPFCSFLMYLKSSLGTIYRDFIEWVILCIIIVDVYQFIGNCLILLDP